MLGQLVQGHGDIGKQDVFREQRSSFWLELGPYGEELARELRPAGKQEGTGPDNAGAIQRLCGEWARLGETKGRTAGGALAKGQGGWGRPNGRRGIRGKLPQTNLRTWEGEQF